MTLTNLIQSISGGDIAVIAFLLLSIIQITPIKVNPWSWIAKHIGRAINGEVMRQLMEVRSDLDGMRKCTNRQRADDARNRILQFDDELRRNIKHSQEFFEQIIEDCDLYEQYGRDHPKYPNGKAKSAIKNIRSTYDDVKKTNDFI